MVQTGTTAGASPIDDAHSWRGEFLLRLLGALLQILATCAVVRALIPEEVGIYFRGFVIALGLSTPLRGKYEIFMAQHIIGRRAALTGIPDRVLLQQLARRVLLRSSLLCGVLLVVTADLDIQAPQLQTMLQTYLPFVLAIPCVSLAGFLGEALRAANRTLGIVMAAYAVNQSMLLAFALAPRHASLMFYSWAFFLGSLVSLALAAALARRAFPLAPGENTQPLRVQALHGIDSRELVGIARGLLLWGPLCVLAVWAPPIQMAQYAVAVRTALIVDILLPALNLTGYRETLSSKPAQSSRPLLLKQLVAALLYSSGLVIPLWVLAPATLALYGVPYDSQMTVYALLLGVQWSNGLGRPAVRQAVVDWNAQRIGFAVGAGALAVVLISALGVHAYGALAAAAASLIGALIFNGCAIGIAVARPM